MVISSEGSFSQTMNLGSLPITNFTKEEYKAGHQNWDVLWNNGRTYFANYSGLLTYDGTDWQTHGTPNNTILRSLASSGKDTIYVGGQGELGYFAPDGFGNMGYHSLIDPDNSDLGDIWDLVHQNGKLYALTKYNEITEYGSNQTKRYGQNSFITKLTAVGEEIWFHDQDKGLFKIFNDQAVLLPNSQGTIGFNVEEMILKQDSTYLILTEEMGIYAYDMKTGIKPWKTNNDDFFKSKKIQSSLLDHNGNVIVGTSFGGAVVINPEGKVIRLFDKQKGMNNNYVSALSFDEEGNLWIASQNGVDKIQYRIAQSTFYPDGELEGSIYDIEKWQGKIFFSASTGLYYIDEKVYYDPLQESRFQMVKGSAGQNWGLDLIDNELFVAHHNGAFQLTKDFSLRSINDNSLGAWKFVSLDKQTIAVGTYNGVFVLKKKDTRWAVDSRVPNLDESSRIMTYDKYKNLWVSHPYKKVYKIKFDNNFTNSTITEYDADDGLLTDQRNYVFGVLDEAYVTNEKGVFKYSVDEDRFLVSELMSKHYPPGIHLKRIIYTKDQYWTISDNGTDLVHIERHGSESTMRIKKIGGKENNDYVGGFENLFPLDDKSFLQCTVSGVKLINAAPIPEILNKPLITSVSLPESKDSLIYGGYGQSQNHTLPAKTSAIHFDLSSSTKDNFGHYFMYYMEGLDKNWSEWTTMSTKEYTNLSHGDYTFHAKAVNIYNRESAPASIHFTIPTPWYKSKLAYALASLLLLLGLLSLLLIPRKIYKENTAILESEKKKTEEEMIKVKEETEAEVINIKKEKEAEVTNLKKEKDAEMARVKRAAEEELERINREKLENEILFKNKELAMSTMNLLQKNETLNAIRSEVEKVEKKIKDPAAKKEVKKIISLLRTDDRLEDDWSNFSIHFDQAHHQFLKRIKAEFPQLTPKDQKLCAYLRMNLSTKEIAPLLKISVRGVEISRYRLRKKLEIKKEINLNDYMMNY